MQGDEQKRWKKGRISLVPFFHARYTIVCVCYYSHPSMRAIEAVMTLLNSKITKLYTCWKPQVRSGVDEFSSGHASRDPHRSRPGWCLRSAPVAV